jgi:CrcB protein
MAFLWVALGGAIGSMGRYGLGLWLARHDGFPWATLAANILGSFIIGVCAGFFMDEQRKSTSAIFLIPGFCGGFTTFSAFSLQTVELMREQAWLKAATNAVGSVILCLIFVWLGWMLGDTLRKSPA